MKALARSDRVARRSDYLRTLGNWGRHYAEDRFFIGFLEDVRDRPEAMLGELFRFLDLQPSVPVALSRRRIHSGGSEQMPLDLARELARLHVESLHALESRFGGHVATWRRRAEGLLGG
jgi:hypothetical protein